MEYRLTFSNKYPYSPKNADKDIVCYALAQFNKNVELSKVKSAVEDYGWGKFHCYSAWNKQTKDYDVSVSSCYAFYGFKYPEDVMAYARNNKKFPASFKIVECVIPKHTRCAEGIFTNSNFEGYVSDAYIIKDVICECHNIK